LALADHNRSWVWQGTNQDGVSAIFASTRTDQFAIRPTNGFFLSGAMGIGTDSIANALTVSGNISARDTVIADTLSARYLGLVHVPANDGIDPSIRMGETDTTGFSGVFISYNERTNVFGISSLFSPAPAVDCVSINRFGNVGIANTASAEKLTVSGNVSATGVIYASGGNSVNWSDVFTTVRNFSASWEESADILPTVTNYLSTNNVLLSGLTVTHNLSVGGTIFTAVTAKAIATYIANVGNGVGTSFNLPHNLNTLEIITSVYDNATNIQSYPTVTVVDANTVNVQFSFTPSTNAYRVVIVAATSTNLIAAYGGLTTTAVEKYQFRSSDFNITGSAYFAVDTTSGPVRATLPAAPSLGDTVIFIDTYKTWTANNLVLQRNGNVIESLAEDLSANISGFTFKATWVGAPAGWRIY
jgi:hypothetical protein